MKSIKKIEVVKFKKDTSQSDICKDCIARKYSNTNACKMLFEIFGEHCINGIYFREAK